jgi:APA family basic amino acid/polyamine antiporter
MPSQLFRRKPLSALQSSPDVSASGHSLAKSLGLLDLTCFGIAAVIGAGIFSTIGKAAASGGPAVSILFILTAVACLFSALCYAEFASRIPVSGSAYTYSYATFGEICAWLIGWNLLLEYAIGNSTIAFSWSDYFVNLLRGIQIHLPDWMITDYYSCSLASQAAEPTEKQQQLSAIWNSAPQIGGLRIIADLPALLINFLVSILVYIGIQESKMVANSMVFLKMAVVMLVIGVGFFYVKPSNWSPFAPNGVTGVLAGISSVFFTYIGFDAISTTAEECRNAKRDLPLATLLTLGICTALYVVLSFVLTGMVTYSELNVEDPLALVFEKYQLHWLAGIISISAVVAITSVFLVFQIGQPRIFMSMARDGLLPKRFAKVHPRFRTPAFATWVTCLGVALPTLFLNADIVLDLCSMGTLFAFMFVSAGVLRLEADPTEAAQSSFRVPYINGRWVMPVLFLAYSFLTPSMPENHRIWDWTHWSELVQSIFGSGSSDPARIPYLVFYVVFFALTMGAWVHRWSLIPVLGVLTNLYLIAGIGPKNWLLFLIWCSFGFLVYFLYGYWNSHLRRSL